MVSTTRDIVSLTLVVLFPLVSAICSLVWYLKCNELVMRKRGGVKWIALPLTTGFLATINLATDLLGVRPCVVHYVSLALVGSLSVGAQLSR